MHARMERSPRPGCRFTAAATSSLGQIRSCMCVVRKILSSLTIEHRAAPAPEPFRIHLVTQGETDVHLAVLASDAPPDDDAPRDLDRRLLEALRRADRPLSRSQLRADLRVRNERLGDALVRLTASGAIVRHADHWAVPVPLP